MLVRAMSTHAVGACCFFLSSRRRHTRSLGDWSSDVCSSDLLTAEEFGNVVVRANPDGSLVRMKDVARVELGAQKYNQIGRLNGNPAAIIAIYQLPGSNAIDTVN